MAARSTPPADAALQAKVEAMLDQQRELLTRLARGQERFKRLARSVWRVQEEAQRKLARELHDCIGQNLTAILHLLDQAAAATTAAEPLRKARALAAQTLADTRALSRLLRPQILDDLGLVPALQWLARTFAESHGFTIRLDVPATLAALDGDLATLVFRSVQEALTNAARHAAARRVEVTLRTRAGRLHLTVRDDGRGGDPAAALAAGGGLGGMRDRVRLYDGELSVEAAPGAGFAISIEVPLAPAAGDSA